MMVPGFIGNFNLFRIFEMMDAAKYRFLLVSDPKGFDKARVLFREYAAEIKINLCFQDFETELKEIHLQYHKPSGGLILITDPEGGAAVGCVGVRKLEVHVAELKRMYIKEEYRGLGLGERLLDEAIRLAKELKYRQIRLDTLGFMKAAIRLYRARGFKEIKPYRYNPRKDAIFYELDLE
jgi:putative acetyltransferase